MNGIRFEIIVSDRFFFVRRVNVRECVSRRGNVARGMLMGYYKHLKVVGKEMVRPDVWGLIRSKMMILVERI